MSAHKNLLSVGDQERSTTSSEQHVELRHLAVHEATDEQHGESPSPKRRALAGRTFTRLWISEFACCLVALGCLLAITALLYSFDGQPIPQWRYGITLNTIVSLLATGLVFALSVPVSACLGQLKWLRLRRERQLLEFDTIENASRGPLGSFMLLVSGKGGFFACFGASLVIGMLAIGPFLQQVVNNRTQPIESGGAAIPVAYDYAYPTTEEGIIHTDVDLRMKSAIMAGLLSSNNSASQFQVPVTCSTGNCTWHDYTSLAVCASCTDLTAQLTVSTQNGTYKGASPNILHKLPNGVFLKTYEGQQGLQMTVNNTYQQTSQSPPSIAFKDHNSTLLDVFVIALDNDTQIDHIVHGPYASECILEFCVQDYTAAVTYGAFRESRKGSGIPIQVYNGTGYYLHRGSRTFGVEFDTFKAFTVYLPDLFFGKVSWSDTSSPVPIFPSDVTQSLWLHLKQPPFTLDSMFATIEQSMSSAVRTQPSGKKQVQGSALVQQTVIRVDWPWISLPAAILIACIIFVVLVITYTQRSGLEPWKESSIATLFHGINLADHRKLSKLARPDEMLDTARGLYVRLRSDEGSQFIEETRTNV